MSEPIKSPIQFHLTTLLFITPALAALLYLNLTPSDSLPTSNASAHNYGWPIPIFKRSLTLGSGMEFQLTAVVGNFAISFLIVYAVWWIAEKIIELRK